MHTKTPRTVPKLTEAPKSISRFGTRVYASTMFMFATTRTCVQSPAGPAHTYTNSG